MSKKLSLRSTLRAAGVAIVLLALAIGAALVLLTNVFHRTTRDIAFAVESVRLAQEAEIGLLLHGRTADVLVRRDLETQIASSLSEAKRFLSTPHEEKVIKQASSTLAAYVEHARAQSDEAALSRHQQAVYLALEALAEVNLEYARNAHAAADTWNVRANYIGVGLGVFLLIGAMGTLYWVRRHAFAPMLSLSAAMEQFGKADRDARARESGFAELREINRRFNEMADALLSQRKAQIAFLAGVAHDLRNPLMALRLWVSLAPPNEPLPPEPRLRQMLEKIAAQITRLDRMAGDFLDISRVEAGQLELQHGVHDARKLAQAVSELFAGTTADSRIRLTVPDEPAHLYCDSLRVEQVITNLISNAMKYSPAGSPVEVAVEPKGGEIVFRVTDQGAGISADAQEKLFEPFQRLGLSNGAVPGVGLGLSVVRSLVEAHGGRVEVESQVGVGSSFRAHFPVQADVLAFHESHQGFSHARGEDLQSS